MAVITRDPATLLALAKQANRVALARLLTMVERGGDEGRAVARLVYREPIPYTVGLTGAPGAGKSTLTDKLVTCARGGWPEEPGDASVAVLAIDPSSPFTGGAILGDRVRMQEHTTDPGVFIRSMATRGQLGGLSIAVPDAIRVLGAANMPLVIVETVGVGQMEVDVAGATDTTVVVVNPGWGDSMQANKAGLLEIADLFVINKADRQGVREARRDLEQMLDLSADKGWRPEIVETVAATGDGVTSFFEAIARHRAHLIDNDLLAPQRRARLARALEGVLRVEVERRIRAVSDGDRYAKALEELEAGDTDPYRVAQELLDDVADVS